MVYITLTQWDRVKGSWLDRTWVGVSPESDSVGLGRLMGQGQGELVGPHLGWGIARG